MDGKRVESKKKEQTNQTHMYNYIYTFNKLDILLIHACDTVDKLDAQDTLNIRS